MRIKQFISQYNNYPILFVGTGMGLRYLKQAYSWESLLKTICVQFKDEQYYYNLKYKFIKQNICDYASLAKQIEIDFDDYCASSQDETYEQVNASFYQYMSENVKVSRLKLYIAHMLSHYDLNEDKYDEIEALKQSQKNIASIITTNYDTLLEDVLDFEPLIGNEILLSNPYGSLYKIHGSVQNPDKIIITSEDYDLFEKRYELIRAQLISLFLNHPIIFLGYSINDINIKSLLKTIFSYVEPNSPQSAQIRSNFLLVEYNKNSNNDEVTDYDIEMDNGYLVRINRLSTDNYINIYSAIKDLTLPISVLDIRKVQNIVKEIYANGTIKVNIADDIDSLDNREKILVIGKSDKYFVPRIDDYIRDYFQIISKKDLKIIQVIDKLIINSHMFFPVFGFSTIYNKGTSIERLKLQQINKLKKFKKSIYASKLNGHFESILAISLANIPVSNFLSEITLSMLNKSLKLNEVKDYLLQNIDVNNSNYRRLLCAYDYIAFSESNQLD